MGVEGAASLAVVFCLEWPRMLVNSWEPTAVVVLVITQLLPLTDSPEFLAYRSGELESSILL
jgi:hypothetical protein